MKSKSMLIILFSLIIFFVGCQLNQGKVRENNTRSNENGIVPIDLSFIDGETKEIFVIDKSKINEDLTLHMAIDLFGIPRSDETNSSYPLICSWSVGDHELLYIVFETDNREKFMESWQNGDFILPEESVKYGDEGLRFATDNELKVWQEWIQNHKAVYAYLICDGQKDVLLNLK